MYNRKFEDVFGSLLDLVKKFCPKRSVMFISSKMRYTEIKNNGHMLQN